MVEGQAFILCPASAEDTRASERVHNYGSMCVHVGGWGLGGNGSRRAMWGYCVAAGNSIEMLPSPSGLKCQGSLRKTACNSQLHLELGHPTPRHPGCVRREAENNLGCPFSREELETIS